MLINFFFPLVLDFVSVIVNSRKRGRVIFFLYGDFFFLTKYRFQIFGVIDTYCFVLVCFWRLDVW